MAGSTNLEDVLKNMKITCDEVEYGFASVKDVSRIDSNDVLGTFCESEGLTVFGTKEYFENENIEFEGTFAKLTIEIHTSLELVGLTASLAKKLTEGGVSANVVAAFFHDHIFVQYGERENAIKLLESLKS